jgi:hypothetical protein
MKKYILLLFLGFTSALNAQEIKLIVDYVERKKTNWCTAAAAKCVLDFYGIKQNGKPISQCNIMEYALTVSTGGGNLGCCSPDPPSPFEHICNKGLLLGYQNEKGSVYDILIHFGNLPCSVTQGINGPILPAAIENTLSLNHLLIAHWSYYNPPFGGPEAHAVVIHGIKDWNLVYFMDPSPTPPNGSGGLVFLPWWEFNNNSNNGNDNELKHWWVGTLVLTGCARDYPCHCYNGILDGDETGIDCGGSCKPCETTVSWHCFNRKKDFDETGVDCGGADCPPCEDLPPCANCEKDPGEEMVDCGGTCAPCEDVQDEKIITKTSQLTAEVMAYKKNTAKDATTIASGQTISFITEEDGTIVLFPGFKAEQGSKFSTQRMDLSGSSRICGAICRIEFFSHHHSVVNGSDFLRIYNLHNAVKIEYRIYDSQNSQLIYSNSFEISRNGTFQLWDCKTGTVNPKGQIWYYIVYEVFYCNGASYGGTWNFYVNYKSKSSTEEPEKSENHNISSSPPFTNTNFQNGNTVPDFSVIPNPNSGAFQLETNFPLSHIGNLKITNTLGAIVYESRNIDSNNIQLQNSGTGLYFVVMMLKDGTLLTQKMMLQQ